jgi:hypothetical protein
LNLHYSIDILILSLNDFKKKQVYNVCLFLSRIFKAVYSFNKNAFYESIHQSFCNHWPLCICPDSIWTMILQGLSIHINENSDKLRHLFVDHKDKTKLIVHMDRFGPPGSPYNDWTTYFYETAELIEENTHPDFHPIIDTSFSTTDTTSAIVHKTTIMSSMKSYFTYECVTKCGIPKITLLGDKDDWLTIKEKVGILRKFGMNAWASVLEHIIQKFIDVYEEDCDIDTDFFENIYKYEGRKGSGTVPKITGWSSLFSPYQNPKEKMSSAPYSCIFEKMEYDLEQPQIENIFHNFINDDLIPDVIPTAMTCCPMIWNYLGKEYHMTIFSGFIGNEITKFGVHAKMGWALVHNGCGFNEENTPWLQIKKIST